MSHYAIDKIADLFNPVFAVALIVCAILTLKNAVWPFLIRNGIAIVLAQQISKWVQHTKTYGPRFPSTHYAFALAIGVAFIVLKRRSWPVVLALLVTYAIVVVPVQHYHTWSEVLAALYAAPLVLLFNWNPRRKATVAAVSADN